MSDKDKWMFIHSLLFVIGVSLSIFILGYWKEDVKPCPPSNFTVE